MVNRSYDKRYVRCHMYSKAKLWIKVLSGSISRDSRLSSYFTLDKQQKTSRQNEHFPSMEANLTPDDERSLGSMPKLNFGLVPMVNTFVDTTDQDRGGLFSIILSSSSNSIR